MRLENDRPSDEYIFIYGTLKYAPYKDLLGKCIFIGKSSVRGKLYLVDGTYPGFVEGEGLVLGEIYQINQDQFEKLDEYEGDLYERRKINTTSDIECWIYQYS